MTTNEIKELMGSREFDLLLRGAMKAYSTRIPPANCRFKRTALDELCDNNQYNLNFFKNEFALILQKKSNLPSRQRAAIEYFVIQTLNDLIKSKNKKSGD
jgi:hypothetical protein